MEKNEQLYNNDSEVKKVKNIKERLVEYVLQEMNYPAASCPLADSAG